jgi:6-phosphogluconolactonase (cycloisomerase 2 family)
MKFGKVGQVGLVSAMALVVATMFTACGAVGTLTVDFLYVATNRQTPGQIEVYEVDSESGSLRTIPTSPFPSGGRNPVAEAPSPDSKNLYVVNEDDNNITQFGIGTDGKLYPQSTVNTPGSFPNALAINSAGTFLYVLDILTPTAGCSLTNPCPGDIAAYPITADSATTAPGSLGKAVVNNNGLTYQPLQLTASNSSTVLTPTALKAVGNYVYVTAYNANASPFQGYLFAFSVSSQGVMTPVPMGSNGQIPLSVGEQPVGLVADSAGSHLFLVDETGNQLYSYAIQSDGSVTLSGSVGTGNQPSALTFDGSGKYLYVTNSLDSTVTAYTVGSGTATSFATYATSTNPIAILADPKHVGFLYTVNFLGNSLSGFQINSGNGTLINTQNTPYASTVQPTSIAGIPHGGSSK